MTILDIDKLEKMVKCANAAQCEQIDTFLMQWYSSTLALKPLLLDILQSLHNDIFGVKEQGNDH